MYAFVHIYKTAGTTLTGLLRRNFGFCHFDTRLLRRLEPLTAAQLRRIRLLFPRLKSIAGHEVRPYSGLEAAAPDIEYYTFLRDPDRRIVSAFRFGCVHQIAKEGWRPETDAEVERFLERVFAERGSGMCLALSADGKAAGAIETLNRKIGFVGFVETFDRSLAEMHAWMQNVDFDVRYRRLNAAGDHAEALLRNDLLPYFERVNAFADQIRESRRLLDRIAEVNAEDRALFDYAWARRKTDPENAAAGLQDDKLPADAWAARAYRNVVVRPIVPIIARR